MSTRIPTLPSLKLVAVIYLSLPLVIFVATFLRTVVAVAGLVAIGFILLRMARGLGWERAPQNGILRFAVALALGWTLISGIAGGVYLNFDWVKHWAVFNVLLDQSWPPIINGEVLRYYLGYYLPPAALAKALPLDAYPFVVTAWTTLGLFLALALQAPLYRPGWRAAVGLLLFTVFGGLDVIGTYITDGSLGGLPLPYHFEWWAGFAQISSHTTGLFWVPQHVIPAWICVALIMRSEGAWSVRHAGLLLTAVAFWSPFVAIGLLPFFLLLLIRDWRPVLSMSNAAATPIMLAIAAYFLAGEGPPNGPIWAAEAFTWPGLFRFYALEFGIVAGLTIALRPTRPSWFYPAVAALLLFPLYQMGLYNDWAMRTTLPALAVFSIVVIDTLLRRPLQRALPLLVALVIAAGTSAGEVWRAFSVTRADYQELRPDEALGEGEFRNQYVAPRADPQIRHLLRLPSAHE